MNPVGWFEIYVDDLERASSFYSEVFQLTLNPFDDPTGIGFKMMLFPLHSDAPFASGALVYFKGMKAGGNSTLVYFHSKDCGVEEARVEAAGGKVMRAKMSIGENGFISLCYDTEGNLFGIHSRA